MNVVLILYPAGFKSQSKFDRKVKSITSRLDVFEIAYPHDFNGFISDYCSRTGTESKLVRMDELSRAGVTHAITFDDGEEFPDELKVISALCIPVRQIRVKITRVINIKKDAQFASMKDSAEYQYIGRGSYWGNPYSMFVEGESREEVIRKYKYDFDFDKFAKKEKSKVYELAGKRLGCFCKPDACHGDVLADFLNMWDDGK